MNQFKNEIKSVELYGTTHDVQTVLRAARRQRKNLISQQGAFLFGKVSLSVAEQGIKDIKFKLHVVDKIIEGAVAELKHRRIERIKDKIFGFVVQFFVSLVIIVLYKIWVS